MPESESHKQERQVRTQLSLIFGAKAKMQPGSGNQATSPNDVAVVNKLHVECKTTAAESLAVRYDWIMRAKKLALQFQVPAFLAIRFHALSNCDFFIIPDHEFYSMLLGEHDSNNLIKDNKKLLTQVKMLQAEVQRLQQLQRTERKAYDTPDAYEGQLKR